MGVLSRSEHVVRLDIKAKRVMVCEVAAHGEKSGRIYLPKEWVGKEVVVVLEEVVNDGEG
jgi:putative transposon-encoded protein